MDQREPGGCGRGLAALEHIAEHLPSGEPDLDSSSRDHGLVAISRNHIVEGSVKVRHTGVEQDAGDGPPGRGTGGEFRCRRRGEGIQQRRLPFLTIRHRLRPSTSAPSSSGRHRWVLTSRWYGAPVTDVPLTGAPLTAAGRDGRLLRPPRRTSRPRLGPDAPRGSSPPDGRSGRSWPSPDRWVG